MAKVGRPPKLIQSVYGKLQGDWIKGQAAGTRLPSEQFLAEHYKVSRPTIRGALALLESEKLIIRRPKIGYFVSRFESVRRGHFRTQAIGISFASAFSALGDRNHWSILEGICSELRSAELNLTIPTYDWRWLDNVGPDAFFNAGHILGILLIDRHTPGQIEALQSLQKPMVAVDFDARAHGLHSFVYRNRQAGILLARRLWSLGHRRIAAIFESPEKPRHKQDEAWSERREGFLSQYKKMAGHLPELFFTEQRGFQEEALRKVAQMLALPLGERPTALVLPTNPPVSTITQLTEPLGLSIPKDLTVVGFGGTLDDNTMTAIRFNGYELGRPATQCIMNLVCNKRPPSFRPECVKVKGRYIAGTTHARAPQAAAP